VNHNVDRGYSNETGRKNRFDGQHGNDNDVDDVDDEMVDMIFEDIE